MSSKPQFSFVHRNYQHWDVWDGDSRIFRIRGGEPTATKDIVVIGEYKHRNATPGSTWLPFKTLTAATAWITDYLMHEESNDQSN